MAWAQGGGGLLARRDRVAMAGGLARAQVRYVAERLRLAGGHRAGALARLDPGTVTVPDSRMTREAQGRCHR